MQPPESGSRWIFVEDSPFLPPMGGGELEHAGMLRAAVGLGLVSLIVIPTDLQLDLAPYRAEFPDIPIVTTPRRTSPMFLAHPRDPFVVASRPAPAWLMDRARSLAPQSTGVVITSFKSWRIGEALAKGLALPAVLRMHNREGAYHHSLAAGSQGPRRWALRLDAVRIDRQERRLGRAEWLGGIADISLDDARWRLEAGARHVATVAPFAVDVRRPAPERHADWDHPAVLFLGALDVPTNIAGLEWLAARVWPAVHEQHPGAHLEVVGRRPTRRVTELVARTPGATLHADVPAVEPFLSRACVALNPAVIGSGVNIKLMEYIHAGIPLVSTSLATRGVPLRGGPDLEVHDDPAGFAAAIVRLLENPAAAERMGRTGQEQLQVIIDPRAGLSTLAELMRYSVIRSPGSR